MEHLSPSALAGDIVTTPMSPELVPSGFDPDALLLCESCGQLGPEAKVYPHVGTGPGCTAPLTLVSDEEAVSIGYAPGSGEVVNVKQLLDIPAPGDDLDEGDPDDQGEEDLDDDEEDDDEEIDATLIGGPGKDTKLAASPADGALRRRANPGREKRGTLKLNAPKPGAAKVVRPEKITVSVTLPVSLYTLSLFDVARQESTLGFDGTLAQFLDECPQIVFKLLGFDGMFLLRQNQVVSQLGAAADAALTRRPVRASSEGA